MARNRSQLPLPFSDPSSPRSLQISSMCFNRQTVFVFMVTHSSCTAHPRDIGSSLPWPGRWVDNKEKTFRSPSPFQVRNSARLWHRESPGAPRDFLTPCPTSAALPSRKASRQPALNLNWQAGNSVRCLKKTQTEKGLKCAESRREGGEQKPLCSVRMWLHVTVTQQDAGWKGPGTCLLARV